MSKVLMPLALVCALLCACSSNVATVSPQNLAFAEEKPSGRELFFSDSLNAMGLYRTYPVPNTVYTPAPKGYKPVYISSYARHGSRQLIGHNYTDRTLEVLEKAAELNCLTPLGQDVYDKIKTIGDDLQISDGDLTSVGVEQHKAIADRMYHNYKNVFSRRGTPVRLYSTVTQRTMMSMFSQNARLLELNPHLNSTRFASASLSQLRRSPKFSRDTVYRSGTLEFLREYFDARPVLSRLFTEAMPALKDTASFLSGLCSCASITNGMDLENVDFIWDLFTYDELFILQQATNYSWYNENFPEQGSNKVSAMSPLLRDFIDKADAALAEKIPGADLRFGHDSYLTPFVALIGLNGFVPREEDPLKVIDVFQIFNVAPMAGNIQMVFYRNRAGDVIVKFLLQEVEAGVPLESDIYPYYRWDELKPYLESCVNPDYI